MSKSDNQLHMELIKSLHNTEDLTKYKQIVKKYSSTITYDDVLKTFKSSFGSDCVFCTICHGVLCSKSQYLKKHLQTHSNIFTAAFNFEIAKQRHCLAIAPLTNVKYVAEMSENSTLDSTNELPVEIVEYENQPKDEILVEKDTLRPSTYSIAAQKLNEIGNRIIEYVNIAKTPKEKNVYKIQEKKLSNGHMKSPRTPHQSKNTKEVSPDGFITISKTKRLTNTNTNDDVTAKMTPSESPLDENYFTALGPKLQHIEYTSKKCKLPRSNIPNKLLLKNKMNTQNIKSIQNSKKRSRFPCDAKESQSANETDFIETLINSETITTPMHVMQKDKLEHLPKSSSTKTSGQDETQSNPISESASTGSTTAKAMAKATPNPINIFAGSTIQSRNIPRHTPNPNNVHSPEADDIEGNSWHREERSSSHSKGLSGITTAITNPPATSDHDIIPNDNHVLRKSKKKVHFTLVQPKGNDLPIQQPTSTSEANFDGWNVETSDSDDASIDSDDKSNDTGNNNPNQELNDGGGDDDPYSSESGSEYFQSSSSSNTQTESEDSDSSFEQEDLEDIGVDASNEGEDPDYPIPEEMKDLMDVIGTLGQGLYIAYSPWRSLILQLVRTIITALTSIDAGEGHVRRKVRAIAALVTLPGLIHDYNQQASRDKKKTRPPTVEWLRSLCMERPILVTINMILSQAVKRSSVIRAKEIQRFENQRIRPTGNPRYPSPKAAAIHIRNGRLSRLMRGIVAAGSEEPGFFKGSEEETKAKVQEMNPNNANVVYPEGHTRAGQSVDDLIPFDHQIEYGIDITPDIVRSVIKKLPRDSANGVSGWTFNLFRDIINRGINEDGDDGDELMDTLTILVNQIVKFQLPIDCYYILNSARQILIVKTDVKVRPISVGDVLFRFAAKCLIRTVQDNIEAKLAPIQLCCGTKGGTEIGALLAQDRYDRNLIQHFLDGANAFSTMARRNIEDGIEDDDIGCPALKPFFHASYGRPTELRVTTERGRNRLLGWSTTGVRQGDPMSMILYSLGLHNTLLAINEHINAAKVTAKENDPVKYSDLDISEPSVTAYADDAGVNAPKSIMINEFDTIITLYTDLMFPAKLNLHKGTFVGKTADEDFRQCLMNASNFQDEITHATYCPDGTKVLGIQIGKANYIREQTINMMETNAKACQYLCQSKLNTQVQFALLAKCINAKQWYTVRNTAPILAQSGIRLFDEQVDRTLASFMGHTSIPMEQKILRGLPKWASGMGVTRADSPAGTIAYIKRNELVHDFLIQHENSFEAAIKYVNDLPLTHICTNASSFGIVDEDILSEEVFTKRDDLLNDETLNAVIQLSRDDGSNTLYSKQQDENTHQNFLVAANQIVYLSLLKHIITSNLQIQQHEDEIDRIDSQTYNINGQELVIHNKSLVKGKLAWLLSGVSTPNSESGPPGKKVTTMNTGGLQLDWTGKAFGNYATMSNGIFRAYLCSRLYLPLTKNPLVCTTGDHGRDNAERRAINVRDSPLHGLLCRGNDVPAFATRRHTNALNRLQIAVQRIISNAPPDTVYQNRPIGECTVVNGASDKFYHDDANGEMREIIADTVITIGSQSEEEYKIILDLTIREPHASRFVNGTGTNARLCPGQAAVHGTEQKRLRYDPIVNDHVKLFPIVFESNGHVSDSTHEFMSLLKDFNAPEGSLFSIQQKIAGAIAEQNAMALVEKYRSCYYQIPQVGHIANENRNVNNNGGIHAQEAGDHCPALVAP